MVRWRPRLRRLCFASAALLLGVAAVVPAVAKAAANDPDADRPIVWRGNALASAVHAQADRSEGILPLKDPFYASFPDAESDWDSGSANARASMFFPGPAGVSAVGTICEQVLPQLFAPDRIPIPPSPTFDPACRPAPQYPLVAQADSATPDARTDGSQVIGSGLPLTVMATSAIAHADRSSVASDAVTGSVNVVGTSATPAASLAFRRQAAAILGGPAAAAAVTPQASDNSTLHIDSAVAHTKQVYDTDGALLAKATTTLKGVSLAGGALHIASIDSSSTSRTDGRGIVTHEEHMTLGGVTVSGQPAAIDETGVHVGGSSSSAKPLTDALNGALKAMGAQVTLASTSFSVDDSSYKRVASNVEGLVFFIAQRLEIPNATDTYFATFTLGVVGTGAEAASDRGSSTPIEEGPIGGISTPSESPSAPSAEPAGAFDTGTPASGGTFSNTTNRRSGPRVLGNQRSAGGLLGQLERDLIGSVISHRFDLLYLAFTIAFVGVCLSSRLLVPRARRIS